MKIIALLTIKNESWILDNYFSCISKIADEIIMLDDSSTDESISIAKKYNKVKIFLKETKDEKYVNFSERRQYLLDLGREAGGTHFICLDADEIFSNNFIEKSRKIILSLLPGEKIAMSWINLWKSTDQYISDGSVWANQTKDFIFCDSPEMSFPNKFIHENRTPGKAKKIITIPLTDGVVLHFQFADWQRNQLKQALYRCSELIEGSRNAKRINSSYKITLDSKNIKTKPVLNEWTDKISFNNLIDMRNDWRYIKILNFFDLYGIKFFEPLQIWHITEFYKEFIKRTGRKPKSETYPNWLITLNSLKNKIKNFKLKV